MAKPMTWTEQIVVRRLPPLPSYFDQMMAGFVKPDGTFCGRMSPVERWFAPAHRKARKAGFLYFSISFGKGADIWVLTDRGKPVALEAKVKVNRMNEARAEWSREVQHKLKKRKMEAVRYKIVHDDDGHSCCIPVNREEEWDAYVQQVQDANDYGDPNWPEEPDWAIPFEGYLTFTDPRTERED